MTSAPGARHASVRFVTGALDPFASRAEFLAAARACALPILVIYGARDPAALEGRDRGPQRDRRRLSGRASDRQALGPRGVSRPSGGGDHGTAFEFKLGQCAVGRDGTQRKIPTSGPRSNGGLMAIRLAGAVFSR